MQTKRNSGTKKIIIVTMVAIVFIVSFIYYKSLAFQAHAKKVEEIEFKNGSDVLSGSLYLPKGDGPFSVVIFLHGDGPANRDADGMYNIYFNAFLDKGIACFSYDKPNVGKSTGDWLAQTMSDRAKEALQAKRVLRKRNNIKKIGFAGFSQGSWVISELALLDTDIDFLIVVSGAIDWLDQKEYLETMKLENLGLTEEECTTYKSYSKKIDTLVRKGDYEKYVEYVNQMGEKSDLFSKTPITKDRFNFVHLNIDANATAGIRMIKCPFLGIFGTKDQHVNAQESVEVYSAIFEASSKKNYQICVFEDATHELLKSEFKPMTKGGSSELFFKAVLKGKRIYADGFLDKMGDWVRALD